jgi:hypothetical protein
MLNGVCLCAQVLSTCATKTRSCRHREWTTGTGAWWVAVSHCQLSGWNMCLELVCYIVAYIVPTSKGHNPHHHWCFMSPITGGRLYTVYQQQPKVWCCCCIFELALCRCGWCCTEYAHVARSVIALCKNGTWRAGTNLDSIEVCAVILTYSWIRKLSDLCHLN